jgi:hypothetical protein
MKQATVKSLGAAARGAARPAPAAGPAPAAAGAGDVLQVLPVESALNSLPLNEVGNLAADQTLSHAAPAEDALGGDLLGEATGLLGGVPADPNELTQDPAGKLLGGLPLENLKI